MLLKSKSHIVKMRFALSHSLRPFWISYRIANLNKQTTGLRVNIVTVASGWILQRIAECIWKALLDAGLAATISVGPRDDCDANLYVDMQNCFHRKSRTLDIGFFTHLHENDVRNLRKHWLDADFIIHMSRRYYNVFSEFYPRERMEVVCPADIHGTVKPRKIRIGVVQRGSHVGKGFNFMLELMDHANPVLRNWLHLVFVGTGWDEVVERYRSLGISVTYTKRESESTYGEYYQTLDYLLIPSLWEGGPISLIQAYLRSLPVISSDVGWVPEHFVDESWMMYPPGDTQALLDILERISSPYIARRQAVENLSYADYAARLRSIITRLKAQE